MWHYFFGHQDTRTRWWRRASHCITGTWICTGMLGLGLVAAWGCMIGHNLLLCAFFIYHYFSGRWDPFVSRRRNETESSQANE